MPQHDGGKTNLPPPPCLRQRALGMIDIASDKLIGHSPSGGIVADGNSAGADALQSLFFCVQTPVLASSDRVNPMASAFTLNA
jgi:hypothetical protein